MERRCPGGCVPLSGLTVWKHSVSTLLIFPGKFVLSTQSSYPSLLCPLVISSSTLAFLVHFMSFILELACFTSYLLSLQFPLSYLTAPHGLFCGHHKRNTSQIKCIFPPKILSFFFSCCNDVIMNSVMQFRNFGVILDSS